MKKFTYTMKQYSDVIEFVLNGPIRNDESLDLFSELIENLLQDCDSFEKIVLNFNEVKLINSSGIGKMLMLNKELKAKNKKLFISSLTPALKQLFKFAKIEEIVHIVNSLKEVL